MKKEGMLPENSLSYSYLLMSKYQELIRDLYFKTDSNKKIKHTFPAVSMMSNETNWPSTIRWCWYVASV